MLEAKRTLVKSAPELWAEVSDPAALGRHLAAFGELRITRTEPEALVEWEAERAAGTVALSESGFGTRVALTARPGTIAPEPPVVVHVQPDPELVEATAPQEASPEPDAEREPEPRRGFWGRLFRRRRAVQPQVEAAAPEPEAVEPEREPEPEPAPPPPARPAIGDDEALAALTDTLDALGQAHHRPFSRA